MKRLAIFDLDGTLIDTIEDLAAACDMLLKEHNLPTHSIEEYRGFVGHGITNLIECAIPEIYRTEDVVEKLRKEFIDIYYKNIDIYTKPYKGIEKLLNELQTKEIELAIASNKFQDGTLKLAKNIFPSIKFTAILGQRNGVPLKPNPHIIRDIAKISTYSMDKIIYIGDSEVDIKTGAAADVDTIGVTWGFRSREEIESAGAKYIIDSPEELWQYLE